MLVRIVKNWTYPDLLRQTPEHDGVWNGIHFTLEPIERCDALLILNDLRNDIVVNCPPENVWAIFQEPYYIHFFPWMKADHSQFYRVYTHQSPNSNSRYRVSNPLVPWHIGKTYKELTSMKLDSRIKSNRIAWITSASQALPGHLKRYRFYQFLTKLKWSDLEIWGRGIRPIEDKWSVLSECRYAIAVENYYAANYWTEKIADCWLAETLPFYYGCSNLEKFFPSESFVRIDLDNFTDTVQFIRKFMESGEYEKRLPAIREARDLILNRYQFFPFIANELCNNLHKSFHKKIEISPFRQSIFSKAKCLCFQRFHQRKIQHESM